ALSPARSGAARDRLLVRGSRPGEGMTGSALRLAHRGAVLLQSPESVAAARPPPMHPVADALRIVLSHCAPLPAETTALSPAALGQALAEGVRSDVDVPPFDRAIMDGYAVRSADLSSGSAELTVLEEVTAGAVPRHRVGPGQTTRVMTGAPIPDGT